MTAKQVDKAVKLSVLTALSVLGRIGFAYIPFFKPVSAMVVVAGMTLGPGCGFACGAMSALISNFVFGQGLWTPFQMLAWGFIGLMSGLCSRILLKSRWVMIPWGMMSGITFSLIMDIFTMLWMDGGFNLSRYVVLIMAALPVTGIYMLSDSLFLWIAWGKAVRSYASQ